MAKEVVTFGDIEIKKQTFYHDKNPIFKKDFDINSILISNKALSDEKSYKYFTDCMDDDYKVQPIYILLSKPSAYVKSYDSTAKWISLKKVNY